MARRARPMTEPVSEAPPRLHVDLGCVGNVPFHTSVPLTSLSAVGIFDGNSRGALEPSGGKEERNPRMIPARANRVFASSMTFFLRPLGSQ
jgi:hypothetical protein